LVKLIIDLNIDYIKTNLIANNKIFDTFASISIILISLYSQIVFEIAYKFIVSK